MNTEPRENPLHLLDDEEKAVLSVICSAYLGEDKNLTAPEIAKRLNYSEGKIRGILTHIYQKLDIKGSNTDKRSLLIKRYCSQKEESLLKGTPSLEAPLGENGDEDDEEEFGDGETDEEEKYEPLNQLDELKQKIPVTDIPENPPPVRGRLPVLWIALGILGVVIIVGLVLILRGNGAENPSVAVPTTAIALVQPVETQQPFQTTEVLISKPTDAISPSPIPNDIVQPTSTAAVISISPTPTLEPSRTQTSTAIPTLASLNEGLVAYYPFNGNVDDQSGNGHDGAALGASLTDDRWGNPNSAYEFNGSDNFIRVPDAPDLRAGLKPMSITLWFKSHDLSLDPMVSKFFNSSTKDWGIRIHNGYLEFSSEKGPSQFADYNCTQATKTIQPVQWYFAAFVANEPTLSLYLNGVLVAVCSDFVNMWSPTEADVEIGRDGYAKNYFRGVIDDVRIYNRELSKEEIIALYNEVQK